MYIYIYIFFFFFQEAIDSAVCQYECGRAFIRPSGTEDAVRIFAEAATEVRTHIYIILLIVL